MATHLDRTLGRAFLHDVLSALLLILHFDHAAQFLVRGTEHGDLDSVDQAGIFDYCFMRVNGYLAFIQEFLSSDRDSCERF